MNLSSSYLSFLTKVKEHISQTRLKAIRQVNHQMIQLYWEIGKIIHQKQEQYSWGKSVVEQLSQDLQKEFPQRNGLSARNLWEMRKFYHFYKDLEFLQQLVAEIPWGHNLLIMNKLSYINEVRFYIKSTIEYGWSRNVLLNQIKANAYQRSKVIPKQHNFNQVLEPFLQEQAIESIKSSYNLEFLGISGIVKERELEDKLVQNLQDFLLELGYGFSFIGRQYKLNLGENSYFIDLLFFNRKLQSLVAFELKAGKFKPEFAGKMNFYLELLDEKLKEEHENPAIGIILCAEKDYLEVEYALKVSNKPIGIAEYQLTQNLPKELAGKLPTLKDFKEKFDDLQINEVNEMESYYIAKDLKDKIYNRCQTFLNGEVELVDTANILNKLRARYIGE